MIRAFSLAALTLALTLVSVPAQAGGGRASAQTFRAAAGGCQASASAQGGYCPAASAQTVYRQQVIRQAVPVMQYQQVQRVVEVPVQAVERQVYTEYVPAQQVVQQEVVAPSYTVQSQAAVGYAPAVQSAAAVSYGASASAVAAPAAVVEVQRAPLLRGRLFGGRGKTVTKSRSVTKTR
jgi:hypothetical protein